MTSLLDKILNAPDNARISILYPCTEGRGGEDIGDVVELKQELRSREVPAEWRGTPRGIFDTSKPVL